MGKKTTEVIEEDLSDVISNPECQRCNKLCNNATNVCIPGDGPEDADIMLMAEAPGHNEDKYGIPLIGQVGQYLREELLPPAGLEEDEIFFTNPVRCKPPKNRTPSAKELRNCRVYMENEIRAVKPKVIIAMGNAPLASLTGMIYKPTIDEDGNKTKEGRVSGITRWRGKAVWSREFNCWIMLTFHPSYAMRGDREGSSFVFNQVVDDLSNAALLIDKKPPFHDPKSIHVKTKAKAAEVFKKMRESSVFAYDIETGGAGQANHKYIIGFSFACSTKVGYYMDYDLVHDDRSLYRQYEALMRGNKTKAMHNGSYELKIHNFNGAPLNGRYFDTMIAAHVLDENFEKSLKSLAWVHTGFGGYDIEIDKYRSDHRVGEDYSKIPNELLAEYGGLDAVATYTLYKKFKAGMEKENSNPLFDKIIMPVRRVMSEAEYNGMRVDIDYAEKLNAVCETALERLENKVYKIAGREFNINSPKQLQDVLYNEMDLEPLRRTKTGWSTDKESIEYIASQGSPIAGVLSDRNFLKTMLSNHISQAVKFYWTEDGKVHTSYSLATAVTGRASASRPGIHNVPRDRLIRTMYIASDGNVIIDADLKSAELVYLAAESGEDAFIRAFAEGLDIHYETAKVAFKVEKPTAAQRQAAKSINFGLVYGMTAFGLSRELGITLEEAQIFIDQYFRGFPKIAAYMKKLRNQVYELGYVQSLFRRRRRLPMARSDIERDAHHAFRQAQNAPIQSGAADYTYLGMVRLRRMLNKYDLRAKIIHTVHDCVLVDTPRSEVKQVRGLVKESFEKRVKIIPVQMRVEIEEGRAWGEHTEDSRVLDILKSVKLANKLAA